MSCESFESIESIVYTLMESTWQLKELRSWSKRVLTANHKSLTSGHRGDFQQIELTSITVVCVYQSSSTQKEIGT